MLHLAIISRDLQSVSCSLFPSVRMVHHPDNPSASGEPCKLELCASSKIFPSAEGIRVDRMTKRKFPSGGTLSAGRFDTGPFRCRLRFCPMRLVWQDYICFSSVSDKRRGHSSTTGRGYFLRISLRVICLR